MKLSTKVLTSLAIFAILSAPLLMVTFANPDVGSGILSQVYVDDTSTPVPSYLAGGGQTFYVVYPGGSYKVYITNIELEFRSTLIHVYIKGKYTDGTAWNLDLGALLVLPDGSLTSPVFEIPATAGCTIQVSYKQDSGPSHETENPTKPGSTAHLVTYYPGQYDPQRPEDNKVPCDGVRLPEFLVGPEVAGAIGLLALAIRRKKRN